MSIEHMDRVKSNFSIKNLENLSGIKAHTLRIWEKRYNLLEPDTNRYQHQTLQSGQSAGSYSTLPYCTTTVLKFRK